MIHIWTDMRLVSVGLGNRKLSIWVDCKLCVNICLPILLKEVIGRITILANNLLLAGTVPANNLLLAKTPPGPFQGPSSTLLGPLWSHYGRFD